MGTENAACGSTRISCVWGCLELSGTTSHRGQVSPTRRAAIAALLLRTCTENQPWCGGALGGHKHLKATRWACHWPPLPCWSPRGSDLEPSTSQAGCGLALVNCFSGTCVQEAVLHSKTNLVCPNSSVFPVPLISSLQNPQISSAPV